MCITQFDALYNFKVCPYDKRQSIWIHMLTFFVPRTIFFMILCRILSLCLGMGKWKNIITIYWMQKINKKLHVYGNTQIHTKESMTWLSKES